MHKQTLLLSLTLIASLALGATNRSAADTIAWNLGSGGDWDTTTTNWTADGGGRNDNLYVDGDLVTFGNTAGGTINLTANRAPGSTTVNAASGIYTLSGAGITSGDIAKSGAGTVTISSTYSGSGNITVNAGVMEWGSSYSGASNFAVNAGTFRIQTGATLTLNNAMTGSGALQLNGGSLKLNASNLISDTITFSGGSTVSTFDMNGFDETLKWGSPVAMKIINIGNLTILNTSTTDRSGSQGISGSGSVTFGPGHVGTILSGTSTYAGGTFLKSGIMYLYGGTGSQLPITGAVSLDSGTTFSLNYHNTAGDQKTIGALNGLGNILSSNANTADTIFRVGNGGGSGTYGGVYSGAGSLQKLGGGTQIMNGNNSYAGPTTVVGGKLVVNGTTSGQGNYTVQTTATLAGSGAIGLAGGNAVTLQGGSFLEPGNASVATFTINGGLTLNDGSTLLMDFGPTSDKIVVNGVLTGSASAGGITINVNSLPNFYGAATLIDWTGGSISGLELSDFHLVGAGASAQLLIVNSTLVLSAPVPEPASLSLLALGTIGLVRIARRRRSVRQA